MKGLRLELLGRLGDVAPTDYGPWYGDTYFEDTSYGPWYGDTYTAAPSSPATNYNSTITKITDSIVKISNAVTVGANAYSNIKNVIDPSAPKVNNPYYPQTNVKTPGSAPKTDNTLMYVALAAAGGLGLAAYLKERNKKKRRGR